jgi:hypothetical protein
VVKKKEVTARACERRRGKNARGAYPKAIDDDDSLVWYTPAVRHETMPRAMARPLTERRLHAAERALARERDDCPLFADGIAEEQPTPEQRVRTIDAEQVAHWQRIRDHAARTWRAARRILGSLPAEERDRLLLEWRAAPYPPGAASFADFLWQRTGRSVALERIEAERQQAAAKVPRV